MYRDSFFNELIVDNFAGGGGASVGIELAVGRPVDIAVNHDPDAINMHKVNHPYTQHHQEDVFLIEPEKVTAGRPVGIAWFSPDCKHFSRAKGGKPVSKKVRGLSWVILKWAMSSVAPRCIFMENVPEIQTWGPCIEIDGKLRPDPVRCGETFNGFIAMLTTGIDKEHPAFAEACEFLKISQDSFEADKLAAGLGYNVAYKELKACDYGAPTIRKRFYLVARRDGQPIVFPEPTHGKGKKEYRTAAECIDWSIPCPSIFGRKKDLAVNTQRRIARGLDKFVIRNAQPFIIECNHSHGVERGINSPLASQTAKASYALAAPSLIQYHSEQGGKEVRGQKITEPIMTVDGSPRYAISAAYLSKYFSGDKQSGADINSPAPTVTSIDHNAVIAANLIHYYGGDDHASRVDAPIATVVTKPRHFLTESHLCVLRKNMDCKDLREPIPTLTTSPGHMAQVCTYLTRIDTTQDLGHWHEVRKLLNTYVGYNIADDEVLIIEIDGIPYFIKDIGMRMLKARELMLAQGFPPDYVIDIERYIGKKYSEAKQIARLGNAVCPPAATALIRANCPEICSKKELTTIKELNEAIDVA